MGHGRDVRRERPVADVMAARMQAVKSSRVPTGGIE